MVVSLKRRDSSFSARMPSDFKPLLQELIALVSQGVGTRVSQAQALEIAVREAIEARKKKEVEEGS